MATTIDNRSYYINKNTGQLTTNLSNTAFHGTKAEYEAISKTYALGGNMYGGHEINKMQTNTQNGLFERLNLKGRNSLDSVSNSLNLRLGKAITLSNGKRITLNSGGFEVSGGDPYDQAASQKASDIAGALNVLLRYATNQISENAILFSDENQKQQWSSDALEGLKYLGIDTSKDFTLNGVKFTVNSGVVESQAYSEAQKVYEQQVDKNRTYLYADEKTKIRIQYQTEYYLKNAPEDVKAAWKNALEETNFNPFSNEYPNVLFQLSTEQDFVTGGNDDIFGASLNSTLEAVNAILERTKHPLGKTNTEYSEKEKEFYVKFF